LAGHALDDLIGPMKPVRLLLGLAGVGVLVQVAVMCDLMPASEDGFDRNRISFHTPGGQEKCLSHPELCV
jgi:hypothetical protein